MDKGESLKDTVATLSAYAPEAIVIRHPHAGAAKLVSGWTDAAVVNAGDGKHEHPSQALLDAYTLLDRFGALEETPPGDLEGKRIWIVGDVLHSRVARSCAMCFRKLGAEVTVCGPPTLIPRGIEDALDVEVAYTLDGLAEADVVYALRMQRERMTDTFVPSIREYAANYQIDSRRLGPRQLLMHPGPVNRGIELSPEVIDGPASLITAQVESGLVVRMAILYELLAGGGEPREREHRRRGPARPNARSGSPREGNLLARLARNRGRRGRRARDPRRPGARPARGARRDARRRRPRRARSPSWPPRERGKPTGPR